MRVTESYHSKDALIGSSNTEKIAEAFAIFIYNSILSFPLKILENNTLCFLFMFLFQEISYPSFRWDQILMISATPLSVSGLVECTAQHLTGGTIGSGLSGVSIIPWGHGARSYLLLESYLQFLVS